MIFNVNEKQRNMAFVVAEIFAHGVLTAVSWELWTVSAHSGRSMNILNELNGA